MTHPLRIIALCLLVIPAIGIVLFGPRPQQDVPAGRVVVEYWDKWGGADGTKMGQIIQQFNDTVGREQNIYVRYLATSEIEKKTLVAIAAGAPPDIAGMWDHTLIQYAALDALQPLDDLARDAGITEATYKPAYWRACHFDDHLYALISTPGVVAMLYNRVAFEKSADVLRAKGLDPNRAPRTIAELDAYSDALTQIGPDGHILRVGYLPLEPGWYLPYTAYWFGGSIWDEKNKKISLTDPAVVAAYDWFASYSSKLGAQEVISFRSISGSGSNWQSPQNPFITETVLMEQNGPWMCQQFDLYCPEKQRLLWSKEEEMKKPLAERKKNYFWAAAAFPSKSGAPVSYCTSDVITIPRGAKHKKEAFVFMAYLTRQDIMEELCSAKFMNSPLAKVSDGFIAHHPNPYIDVYEQLAAEPNAYAVPKCPILQEVNDDLRAVSERVTLLQGDAATVLAESQKRLEAKYEDFEQMQEKRHFSGH